jgi:hypothetical protein
MAQAEGTEEFRRAALALRLAADRTLKKEVTATLRSVTRPLAVAMIQQGSSELPRRGGLSARVAATKAQHWVGTTGNAPSAAIKLRTREGYKLKGIDEGTIRHPIFKRGTPRKDWKWRAQSIRSGAFTRPFLAGADAVRDGLMAALERVTEDIEQRSRGNS